jgi:hypothetical protein
MVYLEDTQRVIKVIMILRLNCPAEAHKFRTKLKPSPIVSVHSGVFVAALLPSRQPAAGPASVRRPLLLLLLPVI